MGIRGIEILSETEEDTTDYKALLKRYIHHVWDSEGTDFIEDEGWINEPKISEEDRRILRELTKE